MARGDGIHRPSARNARMKDADIDNAQAHNEREKSSYVNQDTITDIGHIAYDRLDSYPVSFALFQQIGQLLAIRLASVCYLNPSDDSVITHRNMCFVPEKCGCRRLMPESCIFIIFRANLPNAVIVQQFFYTIV